MHVIGTAGHVDHGKSTLVERLTGIDPDRFAEEKRRGLTIDLGFAWMTLPSGEEIGLIDVPGHERFISNMLSGTGGISICLFVVAANEGWKPQSAEHLSIIHTLGVSSGLVAITKMDTVDDATLERVRDDVRARLEISTLAAAPIVACSAITGEGIDELIARLDEVVAEATPPLDRASPRLWVDRVFTIGGAGTVVTGTLGGGSFRVGDEVEVLPSTRAARIRTIQSHKKEVAEIGPGNRTALNLVGLERTGAARGDAVVAQSSWPTTRRFDAEISLAPAEMTRHDHELREKGSHLLYVGSAETTVKLKLIGADALRSGETGFAQIVLPEPLPLARGDRFVLRDAGRIATIGGGRVLDPLPDVARRRDESRTQLLADLTGSDDDAVIALVQAHRSLERRTAMFRAGLKRAPTGVAELGSILVSPVHLDELMGRLRGLLEKHHEDSPLERGLPRERARAATELAPDAFDALVEMMEDVTAAGTLVHMIDHAVELSSDQTYARTRIIDLIEAGGFAPPMTQDLDADPALIRALTESGELERIGDFHLTKSQARSARELVWKEIKSSGPVTVARIRDLLGTTRKYAVPLCEWLDATGATSRRGDLRTLGPKS